MPDDAIAMREEPFGPLALLSRVRDLDAAIGKANSVPYGLAGYAFTHSARNAEQLAEGVEVGNLSINHFVALSAETPFGGVKDSPIGREGGIEGLQCYTVTKNVSHLTGSAMPGGRGAGRRREMIEPSLRIPLHSDFDSLRSP